MRRWWLWIVGGVAALALLYFAVTSAAMIFILGDMLTVGKKDWAGLNQPSPEDPMEVGYRGDPRAALGLDFETVTYATELGDAEAWLIPAATPSTLWAVFVHGIGGLRENGYRMADVFHEAGVPVLMITYRNDRNAPVSTDNLYSFGLAEWRDLEAAVNWVIGRGAQKVIVAGESMGGGVVGQYLKQAADKSRIAGVVLDSPALDFPDVIRAGVEQMNLPFADVVASAGLGASSLLRRDLRGAESIEAVAGYEGPIFLAHGRRDPLVPYRISERLKGLRSDIIFVETDADRHLWSYQADPAGYRAALLKLIEAAREGG
jgi:pimeloyl-ACP methyl ester carboxylesterase